MKKIKLSFLILCIAVLLSSCPHHEHGIMSVESGPYSYNMELKILDSSGTDLIGEWVSSIVEDEDYKSNPSPLVFPSQQFLPDWEAFPCMITDRMGFNRPLRMSLMSPYSFWNNEETWRLLFSDWTRSDNCNISAERIIIRISNCPEIFGDNLEHELVTYWRPYSDKLNFRQMCYRVEYGDKVFTDIIHETGRYPDDYKSIVTIILD